MKLQNRKNSAKPPDFKMNAPLKKHLKTATIIFAMAVFGFLAGNLYHTPPRSPLPSATSDPIPTGKDFTFTDADGYDHRLSDFKGKTVILNFWASWCAPCVKEMPILVKAAQDNKDTVLIALSSDIDQPTMEKFLEKYGYRNSGKIFFALDNDQKITAGIYNLRGLPQTFIISPNGDTKAHLKGADWDAAILEKHLEN